MAIENLNFQIPYEHDISSDVVNDFFVAKRLEVVRWAIVDVGEKMLTVSAAVKK